MSLLPPRKPKTDIELSEPSLPTASSEAEATSAAPVDTLTRILEQLTNQAGQAGLNATQLEAILTKVGLSTAEGMRQTLRPENAFPTNISAFFTTQDCQRYGSFDAKPALSRKTFFVGAEEQNERLMPAEIEAYNAITESREARGGKWKAILKRNGRAEELWVEIPCETVDQRMDLPSLLLILHELNGGQSTESVHQLVKQLMYLKGLVVTGVHKSPSELEAELLAQ